VAIPLFNERKAREYQNAIQEFSIDEILNAKSNLRCWNEFKTKTDYHNNNAKAYGDQSYAQPTG